MIKNTFIYLWLERSARRIKFRWVDCRKPIILILQPGKVGSSSLYGSLKNSHLHREYTVLHIHSVTQEGLGIEKERHRSSRIPSRRYPSHIVYGEEVARWMRKNPNKSIYTITMTREPISREFSSLFESLDELPSVWTADHKLNIPMLADVFSERLLQNAQSGLLDEWFKREIEGGFGIDVFALGYDVKKGYALAEVGNRKLMVFRIEDSSKLQHALADFLDRSDIPDIKNYNVGGGKWYASEYSEFKENYQVEAAIVEKINQSLYATTFYS
jgi:hypothetical protein